MITVLYALVYRQPVSLQTKPQILVQYLTIQNNCNTGLRVSPLIEIDRLPHDKGDGVESISAHMKQTQTEEQRNYHYRFIHV
jgi:hypothetical protein